MRYPARSRQRGFALLLVFAMAAAALVLLYLEMPRVAFEHQRDKEGLLVERGEQYVRAIQLYVQKYNKYPQRIEDLESSDNIRFLRHRYRDPMTGDEQWRLVHIDAMGQYTDSLTHKRQDQKKESGPSVLASNIQGIGSEAQVIVPGGAEQPAAAAVRRTASDRIIPGMPGSGAGPQPAEGGAQEQESTRSGPQPPQAVPPLVAGAATTIGGEPGSPAAQPQPLNPFRMPGTPPPGVAGGQQLPGQPAQVQPPAFGSSGGFGMSPPPPPSSATGGIPGGLSASGSMAPGGVQTSGLARPGAPNQALQAIQTLLTRTPQQGGAPAGGLAIGGGIAGVASNADMEGIRVYNEKTNYKEWEFLFDARKAMQAAGIATPAQQPGAPSQLPGRPAAPSPFQSPGTGSSSGFTSGGSGPSAPSSSGASSFGMGSGFGSSGGASQPRPAPASPIRP